MRGGGGGAMNGVSCKLIDKIINNNIFTTVLVGTVEFGTTDFRAGGGGGGGAPGLLIVAICTFTGRF